MADNVDITPGSGTTIATDDVGGIQYQVVKLDVGGDGVSTPASEDAPVPIGNWTDLHSLTGRMVLLGELVPEAISTYGSAIPCTSVRVKSAKINAATALVYVGNAAMVNIGSGAGSGYELDPGESVDIAATDVRDVYVASVVDEEPIVYWVATVRGTPGDGTWIDPQV